MIQGTAILNDMNIMNMRRAANWVGTMESIVTENGIALPFSTKAKEYAVSTPYIQAPFQAAGHGSPIVAMRETREQLEDALLAAGATRATGAGNRRTPEAPDRERTCFERDRDRIIHSAAFRRLAGKTQVFIFPEDHQRTRLTHALEVAQVATAISRAASLNISLTEAIALGHDCGHGPGGHASEDALSTFLPEGFDHAPWGADVTLSPLNLCAETLDGIRNHSWTRPSPGTVEGMVVRWADRCAYCAHDLEDAARSGIVSLDWLPRSVREVAGVTRSQQLNTFIGDIIGCIRTKGVVGMSPEVAHALGELRHFNYEYIYNRKESVDQGKIVIEMLQSLVNYFIEHPEEMTHDISGDNNHRHYKRYSSYPTDESIARRAVSYVAMMTDRFAFNLAIEKLGWTQSTLPSSVS